MVLRRYVQSLCELILSIVHRPWHAKWALHASGFSTLVGKTEQLYVHGVRRLVSFANRKKCMLIWKLQLSTLSTDFFLQQQFRFVSFTIGKQYGEKCNHLVCRLSISQCRVLKLEHGYDCFSGSHFYHLIKLRSHLWKISCQRHNSNNNNNNNNEATSKCSDYFLSTYINATHFHLIYGLSHRLPTNALPMELKVSTPSSTHCSRVLIQHSSYFGKCYYKSRLQRTSPCEVFPCLE
jgi:hypothetical protein